MSGARIVVRTGHGCIVLEGLLARLAGATLSVGEGGPVRFVTGYRPSRPSQLVHHGVRHDRWTAEDVDRSRIEPRSLRSHRPWQRGGRCQEHRIAQSLPDAIAGVHIERLLDDAFAEERARYEGALGSTGDAAMADALRSAATAAASVIPA